MKDIRTASKKYLNCLRGDLIKKDFPISKASMAYGIQINS
jgi:hypothetical protein